MVQFAGGALENAYPGREGMTTSKETELPLEVLAGVMSGWMMAMNSKKDPGHP